VRGGIARLRHALRHVAEKRGAQLANELGQDCSIRLDVAE
jgi:hypothetical protein